MQVIVSFDVPDGDVGMNLMAELREYFNTSGIENELEYEMSLTDQSFKHGVDACFDCGCPPSEHAIEIGILPFCLCHRRQCRGRYGRPVDTPAL